MRDAASSADVRYPDDGQAGAADYLKQPITPTGMAGLQIGDSIEAVIAIGAGRQSCDRSEVYADALREYVARHSPDGVTDSLNRVLEQIVHSPQDYRFVAAAPDKC